MRPSQSYREQGRDAYAEDVGRDASPYPVGSLRGLEWDAGWVKARVGDPLAGDFADDEEAFDLETLDLEGELRYLEREIRSIYGSAAQRMPSVEQLASAASLPLADWPGNCMGVATALKETGLLDPLVADCGRYQVTYGSYVGFIAEGSIFGALNHHAWIEFENGLVVDPTRWVFTCSEPEVAVSSIEDYDLAGIMAGRRLRQSPAPDFNPEVPVHETAALPADTAKLLDGMLGKASRIKAEGKVDYVQLMWLGKRTLEEIGEHANPFYDWLLDRKLIAVVPVDNRVYLDHVMAWRDEDAAAAPAP